MHSPPLRARRRAPRRSITRLPFTGSAWVRLALVLALLADAAKEGRDVITGMLITGLVFLGVIGLGTLSRKLRKKH
jgi:hypothetical protein